MKSRFPLGNKTEMAWGLLVTLMAWPSLVLVGAGLSLSLSPTSIAFPDANPSVVALIPANFSVLVKVSADVGSGTTWSVQGLAGGDLINTTDGASVIAISNVRWTASQASSNCSRGCACLGGIESKTTPVNLITGKGRTPGGGFQCFNNYFLSNQWSYNTGFYTQSITITATAP